MPEFKLLKISLLANVQLFMCPVTDNQGAHLGALAEADTPGLFRSQAFYRVGKGRFDGMGAYREQGNDHCCQTGKDKY